MLAFFEQIARGGAHGPRFIFPLLLLLAIGGLGTWLLRRRNGDTPTGAVPPVPPVPPAPPAAPGAPQIDGPLETLRDRFARGELSHQDFEHRRAVLTGAAYVPPAPGAEPRHEPAAPEDLALADELGTVDESADLDEVQAPDVEIQELGEIEASEEEE